MITQKIVSAFGVLILIAAMASIAKAGESDQLTKFTFDKSVEVPAAVLPAGSYWFMVSGAQNDSQLNIIRIFNADRSKLVAAVMATPIQHRTEGYGTAIPSASMNGTGLQIAEGSANHPSALVSWFYPYGYSGHEFYYPATERNRHSEEPVVSIMLNPNSANSAVHT